MRFNFRIRDYIGSVTPADNFQGADHFFIICYFQGNSVYYRRFINFYSPDTLESLESLEGSAHFSEKPKATARAAMLGKLS